MATKFVFGVAFESYLCSLVLYFNNDIMIKAKLTNDPDEKLQGSLYASGLSFNPDRHFKFNLCLHEGFN